LNLCAPSRADGPVSKTATTAKDEDIPSNTSAAAPASSSTMPEQEEHLDDEGDDDEDKTMLIPSDTYDGLVCAACIRSNPYLTMKAGTQGWMIIEPSESVASAFEVIGRDGVNTAEERNEAKRKEREADEEVPGKKAKVENGESKAVPASPLENVSQKEVNPRGWKGKGDVFLAEGIRESLKATLDVRDISKQSK
jgi:E3 ubiquitin-protein ligase UBR7